MKIYDIVKVVCNKKIYNEKDVFEGMIGTIFSAEIRDNSFLVFFEKDKRNIEFKNEVLVPIKINDLCLLQETDFSDKQILTELPKNNPKWWCKVEDGYILNLLGEKKNKIPYDYNS